MYIIPAIDLIDGQCVRLTQGDYAQLKVYHDNPEIMAQTLEAQGIQRLHLVDLDGARSGRVVNLEVLKRIAQHTQLHIDFGGGLKTTADLEEVFAAGARQVTIGTLAVKAPQLVRNWLKTFGPEKIIIGADVLNGAVMVRGWQEGSNWTVEALLEAYRPFGLKYLMCTDISRDGKLKGTALELYAELRQAFPEIQLIASGGIRTVAELDALETMGCYGAIVGKALYEGYFRIEQGRWIEVSRT
ncbi:MAG: 1-(5-phosphoribosyl)-5-[(5-phosphoribosylamino)methylideneamino]imidazole-4-carboxamide isomerase [Phaeodactylibacter sp.]|nr:1-(5-phosphoribosyl)-5-[(5-phosphoribosylamino)methylideneamino]imidazole-4-carboxamide isomerase [Phaeodactylibacter sp.]